MAICKKLVIEALVETNRLYDVNPALDSLKAYFSDRCAVTESIDESSGAAKVFVSIEGDIEFTELEEVGLDIMRLSKLGCRISVFDQREKRRSITHANNALVYGEPETSFRPAFSRPLAGQGEGNGTAEKSRWGRSAALWLAIFAAVLAYQAITLRNTTPVGSPPDSVPGRQESLPVNANAPGPPPTALSPVELPDFQIPMLGVPAGNTPVNQATLERLQKIVRDYHSSHTYSKDDLFVCVDMAIDVWNILKTKRIAAKIMAGRVDQDITHLNGLQYIGQINHAWVVAEPLPGAAVPLEITGGFVVTPDMPNYRLYFEGPDFSSIKAFKGFIELRSKAFDTCQQVHAMEDHFNATFAGRPVTEDAIAYKGRLEQKAQDCVEVLSQLQKVFLVRN